MSENEFETEVVDVTDETESETESEFPWKPVIAALAVGATSAAVVAKIRKIRKNKVEVEAAPSPESTTESTPVPPQS